MPKYRLKFTRTRTLEIDAEIKESELVDGQPSPEMLYSIMRNNWDRHITWPAIETKESEYQLEELVVDPADHRNLRLIPAFP